MSGYGFESVHEKMWNKFTISLISRVMKAINVPFIHVYNPQFSPSKALEMLAELNGALAMSDLILEFEKAGAER